MHNDRWENARNCFITASREREGSSLKKTMALLSKDTLQKDNARKIQANEYLRNAERFLKSGNFVEALSEIGKTLAIDPKNFYARAY